MNKAIRILIVFLVSVGCFAYIYGVSAACIITLSKHPNMSSMPSFLATIVTSIGAVLATNLGAVLGISIASPDSPYAKNANWNPLAVFSDPTPSKIQILACYIYILVLIIASIVWGLKNFTTDSTEIVPLVPELTKSLLGVIVGVLAISLANRK